MPPLGREKVMGGQIRLGVNLPLGGGEEEARGMAVEVGEVVRLQQVVHWRQSPLALVEAARLMERNGGPKRRRWMDGDCCSDDAQMYKKIPIRQ